MGLFEEITNLFAPKRSAKIAADRLRLALIYDRCDVSPEVLAMLRDDLIRTIKKYLDIDEKGIEIDLNNENYSVALLASIPLKNMHRSAH